MLSIELTQELLAENKYPGDCKRCLIARALIKLNYQDVWVDEKWLRLRIGKNLKYFNLTQEAINLIDDFDEDRIIKLGKLVIVDNF